MMFRSICVVTCLLVCPQIVAAELSDFACDDRARLQYQLSDVLGAKKQGQGLRGPDAVIEVWTEPHSGDWTMIQNYANGTSCIVAMGEHWEMIAPRPSASKG
ncbi:MAG: hypothetical protein ABJH07_06080 [Sedimentitalea sp.]|uniref:hypothetical protein n=1 Tax=Sedimentitalea sp. TaxID=2048915 RepID=UPI0032974905